MFPAVLFVTTGKENANTLVRAVEWAQLPDATGNYFKVGVTTTGLISQNGILSRIWYGGVTRCDFRETAPNTAPPMHEGRSF